jgi:hypothetical protein
LTPGEHRVIQDLAGYGLKNEQIAQLMGMGKMTLIAHFQEDLDVGRVRAHEQVTKTLFAMATDGEHPNETKFYLKAQCGWKEATQIEFPDEDGKPQSITGNSVNISAEKMQAIVIALNEKV